MQLSQYITRPALSLAAAAGFTLAIAETQAIEFSISSIPGSELVFTPIGGGLAEVTIETTHIEGLSFEVDAVIGGTGSAVGYLGGVLGGVTIGPVSVLSGPDPLIEVAPVDGGFFLGVVDGLGGAGLGFAESPGEASNVSSPGAGVSGGGFVLPFGGTFGSDSPDPDLLEFFGPDRNVTMVISYTPPRSTSLADLIANGGRLAFSGSLVSTAIEVPDSGTTLTLLGLGVLGLAAARRRLN